MPTNDGTVSSSPRDHVHRPDLPWRDGGLTECGKPANDVGSVITREELRQRIQRDGIQRAAYSTCMTCLDASRRWKDWAGDPVDVMAREFYGGRRFDRLGDELRAIAALVAEHREEFDGYLAGLAATVDLDAVRQARLRSRRPRR